jgi:glucose-1-phosphate adenylyltransferase
MSAYRDPNRFEGLKATAVVLAGGRGERLRPLTDYRAKAAVPFGGMCRLIDFVVSNLVNSGIREIIVITQEKADSLLRHLQESWPASDPGSGFVLRTVPPRWEGRDRLYLGTANAVLQNLGLILNGKPDLVLVFGADHVYTMDVRQMIRWHLENGAQVTVATRPLPVTEAGPFGTVLIDRNWRIREFAEKSPQPKTLPGRSDQALVSMGNYIFDPALLHEALDDDSMEIDSRHDFGRDILPEACRTQRVYAYDFRTNIIPGVSRPTDYWRDVGTIESFYRANMELNNPTSHLDLYHPDWPVRSLRRHRMPPKVVPDLSGKSGFVENSILGNSTIVSGAYVRDSVIGPNVRILSGAIVEESVLLGDVTVGERARIRRAIIDHGNRIGESERVGYDRDLDAARYHLDGSGIVVMPHVLPAGRQEPVITPRRAAWESDVRFVGART